MAASRCKHTTPSTAMRAPNLQIPWLPPSAFAPKPSADRRSLGGGCSGGRFDHLPAEPWLQWAANASAMATDYRRVADFLRDTVAAKPPEEIAKLKPHHGPAPPRVPSGNDLTPEAIESRWRVPTVPPSARAALLDDRTAAEAQVYARNIENFIGAARVPIGLIGPLRVNGLYASGDYYVPLATTEAALIASHSRGATSDHRGRRLHGAAAQRGRQPRTGLCLRLDCGCRAVRRVGNRRRWTTFRRVASETTRYGRLIDLQITLEGNHVYLGFEFTTGDASGQNMVTIATDAICQYIARARRLSRATTSSRRTSPATRRPRPTRS